MRRWIVTPLLLTAAAIAALLAPRLLPDVIPMAYEIPHAVPAHLIEVPALLNEPEPLPDAFWIDAVDCGMG